LRRLDIAANPRTLLRGTCHAVERGGCLVDTTSESGGTYLARQTYHSDAANASTCYHLTLGVFGEGYARLVVCKTLGDVDLAEMMDTDWSGSGLGFNQLWISTLDAGPISSVEASDVKLRVEHDLLFDFAEEDLDIAWWEDLAGGVMYAQVRVL
jgi:hypothetical protein